MTVLFLTHRLPYAPNRGDRVRAFFLLKELSKRADVHVVSLVHDANEAARAADLADVARSVHVASVPRVRNLVRSFGALPTTTPTTHTMLDSQTIGASIRSALERAKPNVVLAYCSGMARLAMRPPLSAFPFILDMVDVDSAKWQALGKISRGPLGWVYRREARVLARFEAEATMRAASTLVVTARERETLQALAPSARVEVVTNGVDLEGLCPRHEPTASTDVVFCGVMNYAPNVHAAVLLAREVWPLVRARRPDATLTLLGAHPTRAVRALAGSHLGIRVTGSVPDVRPYLWRAALAVAPILTARGIQNKVLEAVAAGLPTVVTPNIVASLPAEILPAIASATGAGGLAERILELLELTPLERRALAGRAQLGPLSWERRLAPIHGLLVDAARTRPSGPVDRQPAETSEGSA